MVCANIVFALLRCTAASAGALVCLTPHDYCERCAGTTLDRVPTIAVTMGKEWKRFPSIQTLAETLVYRALVSARPGVVQGWRLEPS